MVALAGKIVNKVVIIVIDGLQFDKNFFKKTTC